MGARVLSEDPINQRLVPNVVTLGFCSEALQDVGIETDRNQLTCGVANRGTADSSHRAKLFGGRLRNIREVSLSRDSRTVWRERIVHPVDALNLPFIGREALLRNKRATGRAKDLTDVEILERQSDDA